MDFMATGLQRLSLAAVQELTAKSPLTR